MWPLSARSCQGGNEGELSRFLVCHVSSSVGIESGHFEYFWEAFSILLSGEGGVEEFSI